MFYFSFLMKSALAQGPFEIFKRSGPLVSAEQFLSLEKRQTYTTEQECRQLWNYCGGR